jgi:hypothetical protein
LINPINTKIEPFLAECGSYSPSAEEKRGKRKRNYNHTVVEPGIPLSLNVNNWLTIDNCLNANY